MAFRVLVFSITVLGLVGCNFSFDGFPQKIDLKSFSWLGSTFFSDPPHVSMKEVHLESTLLLGRDVIVEGKVVASQKSDPRAPFVGFSQWAGHMYLYSRDVPALNNCPEHNGKTVRAGVRQYTRALQGIPAEMRSRFLPETSAAGLALWELKKTKENTQTRNART